MSIIIIKFVSLLSPGRKSNPSNGVFEWELRTGKFCNHEMQGRKFAYLLICNIHNLSFTTTQSVLLIRIYAFV